MNDAGLSNGQEIKVSVEVDQAKLAALRLLLSQIGAERMRVLRVRLRRRPRGSGSRSRIEGQGAYGIRTRAPRFRHHVPAPATTRQKPRLCRSFPGDTSRHEPPTRDHARQRPKPRNGPRVVPHRAVETEPLVNRSTRRDDRDSTTDAFVRESA